MRILYVAHKSPFPIADGGCFAMMQLLQSLHQVATVDALIYVTHKHPFTSATQSKLASFCEQVFHLPVATEIKPIAALLALLQHKNYNLSRYCSTEIKSFITTNYSNYDAIVCDGLFSAAQFASFSLGETKLIIRAHNVEHQIWGQQAQQNNSFVKRWYLKQLTRTLRQEELNLLNKAQQVWTLSQADTSVLSALIQSPITTIPISITTSNKEVDYSVNQCFHLGSMNWTPNKEAVDYLINELWRKHTNLPKLVIGGSFLTANSFPDLPEHCLLEGKVDDALAFMAKSGILVSPIKSGSGVRVKLLEALSLGVPVITTTIGACGIASEEAGIVIADTANDFLVAINDIVANEQKKRTIGEKGRNYIATHHQELTIVNQIKKALGN